MKPLAFIALRTEPSSSEQDNLREIAIVRADAVEAQPTDVYAARIRSIDGVRPGDEAAVWLAEAMDHVRELSRDCVLVAFGASAIRTRLERLCEQWELLPLDFADSAVDLRSLAWPLVVSGEVRRLRAQTVYSALGVEARPGLCALEEVRAQAEVYRRLLGRSELGAKLAGFSADERAIVTTIVDRIAEGRNTYGEWRVDDGRNNPKEALAEVMDALNYCAAELVRLSKGGRA